MSLGLWAVPQGEAHCASHYKNRYPGEKLLALFLWLAVGDTMLTLAHCIPLLQHLYHGVLLPPTLTVTRLHECPSIACP